MASCPVCDRSFESSLSNEFLIHVNSCLDSQEENLIPKNYHIDDEARLDPLIKKQKERQQANDCVVCGKVKATAAHIKKCGKQYGVGTSQLIRLVGNETNENPNLQNIVLKDSTLNKDQIVNNLFTENDQLEDNQLTGHESNETNQSFTYQPTDQPAASHSKYFIKPTSQSTARRAITALSINPQNDYTIVLDRPNEANKNGAQTKLKVIRKSRAKDKLPNGLVEDQPLHSIKRKKTVRIKRNPLVKVEDLEDKIVQNFRDEFQFENELPVSWRLANLNHESSSYIVEGFDEFCKSFDFKERMNGFEIGIETKM